MTPDVLANAPVRHRPRRLNPDGPSNSGLTPMEIHAWGVLNRLYQEWMALRPKETQTTCARAIGYTQSNLSLYLTGAVPIRERAALMFAEFFKCALTDLRPDLAEMAVIDENLRLAKLLKESLDMLSEVRKEVVAGGALEVLMSEAQKLTDRATDRANFLMVAGRGASASSPEFR